MLTKLLSDLVIKLVLDKIEVLLLVLSVDDLILKLLCKHYHHIKHLPLTLAINMGHHKFMIDSILFDLSTNVDTGSPCLK